MTICLFAIAIVFSQVNIIMHSINIGKSSFSFQNLVYKTFVFKHFAYGFVINHVFKYLRNMQAFQAKTFPKRKSCPFRLTFICTIIVVPFTSESSKW